MTLKEAPSLGYFRTRIPLAVIKLFSAQVAIARKAATDDDDDDDLIDHDHNDRK